MNPLLSLTHCRCRPVQRHPGNHRYRYFSASSPFGAEPASAGGADGPATGLFVLPGLWLFCPVDPALPVFFGGASRAMLLRENGTTPARRAISRSPSCQCIASAALQGIPISLATCAHISGLNLLFICLLAAISWVCWGDCRRFKINLWLMKGGEGKGKGENKVKDIYIYLHGRIEAGHFV